VDALAATYQFGSLSPVRQSPANEDLGHRRRGIWFAGDGRHRDGRMGICRAGALASGINRNRAAPSGAADSRSTDSSGPWTGVEASAARPRPFPPRALWPPFPHCLHRRPLPLRARPRPQLLLSSSLATNRTSPSRLLVLLVPGCSGDSSKSRPERCLDPILREDASFAPTATTSPRRRRRQCAQPQQQPAGAVAADSSSSNTNSIRSGAHHHCRSSSAAAYPLPEGGNRFFNSTCKRKTHERNNTA
jgi:hypothetical protein